MHPALLTAIPTVIGAASQWLTNRSNSAEAARNRRFQETMSSTAHQREVADMRAAGINSALSAHGSGASSPAGDRAQLGDIAQAGFSARAAQQQLRLLEAQTRKTEEEASYVQAQKHELTDTVSDRRQILAADNLLRQLSVDQQRNLMPIFLAKAKEEVGQIAASAQAARARAMLDEAAHTGALNMEEFERTVGQLGPWAKFLTNLLRSVR